MELPEYAPHIIPSDAGYPKPEPCPFCGQDQEDDYMQFRFKGGGPPPGYSWQCSWCGAEGPMGTGMSRGDHAGGQKAAIEEWNNRAKITQNTTKEGE